MRSPLLSCHHPRVTSRAGLQPPHTAQAGPDTGKGESRRKIPPLALPSSLALSLPAKNNLSTATGSGMSKGTRQVRDTKQDSLLQRSMLRV